MNYYHTISSLGWIGHPQRCHDCDITVKASELGPSAAAPCVPACLPPCFPARCHSRGPAKSPHRLAHALDIFILAVSCFNPLCRRPKLPLKASSSLGTEYGVVALDHLSHRQPLTHAWYAGGISTEYVCRSQAGKEVLIFGLL